MRDKALTEAMGEKQVRYDNLMEGTHSYGPDFSTWTGFGKLWEWAQKQEWWRGFIWENGARETTNCLPFEMIHPDRFADAVYEFLGSLRSKPVSEKEK